MVLTEGLRAAGGMTLASLILMVLIAAVGAVAGF